MTRYPAALILGIVLCVPGRAEPAAKTSEVKSQRKYISGSVRGTLSDRYDITEYRLGIRLHGWASGNSISFSGQPFHIRAYGSGDYYSISGGRLSGSINRFGNGLSVSVSIYPIGGRSRWLYFTMRASGPIDDPDYAPSLSVHTADASLNLHPTSGGRSYSFSGWIDEERFGAEGTAVAGVAAVIAMRLRETDRKAIPGPGFMERSKVLSPVLQRSLIPLR